MQVGSPAVGEPRPPGGQLYVVLAIAATVGVAMTVFVQVGSETVGEPVAPGGQL